MRDDAYMHLLLHMCPSLDRGGRKGGKRGRDPETDAEDDDAADVESPFADTKTL